MVLSPSHLSSDIRGLANHAQASRVLVIMVAQSAQSVVRFARSSRTGIAGAARSEAGRRRVHVHAALQRAGSGIRKKQIAFLGVDVYRVALDVDADAWRAERDSKGVSVDEATCKKVLTIDMLRDVDAKTFFSALEEALDPRIRGIATNLATAENDEGNFMAATAEAAEVAEEAAFDALSDLRSSLGDLKKGDQVKLTLETDGAVTVEAGTTDDLTASTVFQRALVATFTDEKAVSEEARASINKGLDAM